MNFKKYLLTSAMIFGGFAAADNIMTEDIAYASLDPLNCTDTTTFKKVMTDNDAWKDYMSKAGIKSSITVNGKTIKINKSLTLDNCIAIYGTRTDVPTGSKKNQNQSLNGTWKYTGYTSTGQPWVNQEWDEFAEADFMKIKKFVKNPSTNTSLLASVKASKIKPDVIAPSKWKAITYVDPYKGEKESWKEALDRSVDRAYAKSCTSSCSKGLKGYLPEKNNTTKAAWTGSQLYNYVSVEMPPAKYQAGIWNIYHLLDGVYWYSPSYIPAYRTIGKEVHDLSVEITSIKTSPVMEGESYTVNFKICNLGQITEEDPTISYGDTAKTAKNKKLSGVTLKENKCTSSSITNTARSVDKDTTATYKIVVNPNFDNPKETGTRKDNNTDTKKFTINNKAIDGTIKINKVTPTHPYSTESTDITYTVTNHNNVKETGIKVEVGYSGKLKSVSIGTLGAGESVTKTLTKNAPTVSKYEGDTTVYANITAGFENDTNLSDNKASKIVTIQNPDAFVTVNGVNDSNKSFSNITIKVTNKTFKPITEKCSTFELGCLDSSSPQKFTYKIYDSKLTESTSDDELVASYNNETYSLDHLGTKTFTIDRSILEKWVNEKYPDSYEVVQFRIYATIPYYKREVKWGGDPYYTNNTTDKYFSYIPPRDVTFSECTEIEHKNTNYFTLVGDVNPVKMCVGHYPNYPSTQTENGMQTYHYVLYRFFAQPVPRYEVTTVTPDEKDPNFFAQTLTLQNKYEGKEVLGDESSMLIPNTTKNGYYTERGRYLPTNATFKFSIYEKKKNGSNGAKIAMGTITHKIPDDCYNTQYLDLLNAKGCNDVMFFLPNSDTTDKYKKPSEYNTSNKITYPITKTRVPYLNPGEYTFTFEAEESFRYYYQKNLYKDGYMWNNPTFK